MTIGTAPSLPDANPITAPDSVVDIDIVVPVYNEEATLQRSISRLHHFLRDRIPFTWQVTIADNGSTDGTWAIAQQLEEFPGVRAVRMAAKGRGLALAEVWSASQARVVAYMDVDLSTDLDAVLPLVAPLLSGHSDLAIGTRLGRGSRVVRGSKREFISRTYNAILRLTLRVKFSDAQCGFKAVRADVARALLPHVHDRKWFFDTELLVLAERCGLRIAEVPVDWIDDPDSRVDIVATALEDLRGVARVGRALMGGSLPLGELRARFGRTPIEPSGTPPRFLHQVLRFGAIGVASTVAYAMVYLLLRTPIGPQLANVSALLLTTIANTAANRRFTFQVRGRGAARHQFQGLLIFAIGWAVTSGSLAALHAGQSHPAARIELTVLTVANLVATAIRFGLMRWWVFAERSPISGRLEEARPQGSATERP